MRHHVLSSSVHVDAHNVVTAHQFDVEPPANTHSCRQHQIHIFLLEWSVTTTLQVHIVRGSELLTRVVRHE